MDSMQFGARATAVVATLFLFHCGGDSGPVGPDVDEGVYPVASHTENALANDCGDTRPSQNGDPFLKFENNDVIFRVDECADAAGSSCFPVFSTFSTGARSDTTWTGYSVSTSLSGGLCSRYFGEAVALLGDTQLTLTVRQFYDSETTDDCALPPEQAPPASADCIEFDEWVVDLP